MICQDVRANAHEPPWTYEELSAPQGRERLTDLMLGQNSDLRELLHQFVVIGNDWPYRDDYVENPSVRHPARYCRDSGVVEKPVEDKSPKDFWLLLKNLPRNPILCVTLGPDSDDQRIRAATSLS